MMNLEQYLLGKLAEEAVEVAHIALKTQQFGFDEKCAGQPFTNADRTHQELNDLMGIISLLNRVGFAYDLNVDSAEAKKYKVLKYLKYSTELKMVNPEAARQLEVLIQ